jgi:hypothetical protein
VFILEGLKVLCFDTLLQVFILKVDSGLAGGVAEFFAIRIFLQVIVPGNVGGKGVRWLAGYFMGYYTIWLANVKRIFVPFWELTSREERTFLAKVRSHPRPAPWGNERFLVLACLAKFVMKG